MKTVNTPSGRRTHAVIYVRISQDRSGAHLGVDRQREDCEALAERNGWDVVEVYVDNDLSAYSGKPRPGYRRMLADLADGTATVVVAWHTDRLHRSPTELEEYIDLSERRGINTHTCQAGPIDLSTPSGRMTARILGAVARHESEHKGERVARARQQKAKAGIWGGGIRPFGWGVPTGELRKKADKETGEEIEVPVLDMNRLQPEEAAAIEAGTDMLLSSGSVRGWVKWLRDKGFTTTRGNQISHVEARDMLLRARNAGIAIYKGEEVGRGAWEPIIDEPRFRAVAALLTDPTRRTSPGSTPKWFGSVIYKCGINGCTQRLVCTKSGGANRPSYRCPTQHGGGRRADKVDEHVMDLIVERLSRPDAADLLQPAPDGVHVGELQAESEQIRRRLTDTAALFGSGQISMAEFTEASDVARKQLEGVTRQLARAATKDPLVGLVGAADVSVAWKALDLERRRAVLRSLLDVTILPARQGRMPDGGYFDYSAIAFEWKRASGLTG
ncbi:recombinase family protein [Streptomyces sp. H27-C3]|uniref:recombinase family protein n=1 Tax=Streptomyces sp. H27-C3 TaxID=3046305 RepID=UPI0024B8C7FC|nr:recombinase family protein [Streptomyces sp. H27-C3]MDJ0461588.1 recombinase family protein [Streptomyces sp. H27-C3]